MATNHLSPRLADTFKRTWSFAGREFDESRLELRVAGRVVELELKPLEVLVYLLQHRGEVVTKDQLLEAVWPGLNVVEGSLSTAVYKLRRALGDEDSRIVVTVSRVGYRLDGATQTEATRPSASPAPTKLEAGSAVPGRAQWRLLRPLDTSGSSEVWLAEHPKTGELRVFKFVSSLARLRTLKREVTVFRFLREMLDDRSYLVQILEWNFEVEPYFLESEYGGANLSEWAEHKGGVLNIPVNERLRVLSEICRAVGEVHAVGVLHKDLKPANVLVASLANGTERVRVADFGSAALLEPSRLEALGITRLGMTQTAALQPSSFSGTLLYLAPEVFSGKGASAQSDVYALGVMLYQMIVGDFRKPLSPGWEEDVADPLLREDIAAAVCGDPARRLRSPAELANRLDDLESRRAERSRIEAERQRQQIAERKQGDARVRRPWIALACILLLGLGASLYFLRGKPVQPPQPALKSVAVIPFQNAGSDHSYDYLSLPLADEVATTLSYASGLSVQPFLTTSQYALPGVDPRKAGAEMNASSIISGRFVGQGDQLHLTLEAIDVKTGRVLWADTLDAPAHNMIELREKIVARTQGVLAAALGGSAYTIKKGTRPTNNEAYDLYLRALSMPMDSSTNVQAVAMLERSVGLDPNFAPAWLVLGRRYYVEQRYGRGGDDMTERYTSAEARAVALDPDYIPAAANWIGVNVEQGDETKAMQQAQELIRQHPESSDAHYILNYAMRYAGLIDEAQRQCDLALQLEPRNATSGVRSCSILPALRGDYERAERYLRLDSGSDFSKAITLLALLRAGHDKEAVQLGAPHIEQWPSFDMLIPCAQRRPAAEITAIADKVQGSVDPEANYLAAANLAYCGQNDKAMTLLSKAVEGNYCSYPVMDSDPFFNGIRHTPEFLKIRTAGMACQQKFVTAWQGIKQASTVRDMGK
jgi:serine/threonine protein kinase